MIKEIQIFFEPVFDAIVSEIEFQKKWDNLLNTWLNQEEGVIITKTVNNAINDDF